jgi:hypothetical protein
MLPNHDGGRAALAGLLLAVGVAAALGGSAHTPPSASPTHDEVKGSAYWRQLARHATSEADALSAIGKGLAADRRHLYAWHWLLKLARRAVRADAGAWPVHLLPEPSAWAESDNGSFWHLRAALLAEQLAALPADARVPLLRAELGTVWRGHERQGASEARWAYHEHLLARLALAAPELLAGELRALGKFGSAQPDCARCARCALGPTAALRGAADGRADAAWRALARALVACDAPRAGMYAEFAARGAAAGVDVVAACDAEGSGGGDAAGEEALRARHVADALYQLADSIATHHPS